jgi:glycosyltransferase involved in cell wall biosynthesis
MESLDCRGADIRMLVQNPSPDRSKVFTTSGSFMKKWVNFGRFVWERLVFLPHERSKDIRFIFSLANTGEDITRDPNFREADIIHLHWINAGFLSLRSLQKIFDSGKPVIWTFHDMWTFTGGCHTAFECVRYREECGECPYLKKPRSGDLSHRVWQRKMRLFRNRSFTAVAPSHWLASCSMESSLLKDRPVEVIRNPVSAEVFKPVEREEAARALGLVPDKKYILFTAANVKNIIKGFTYFVEAINQLHSELGDDPTVEIIVLGNTTGTEAGMFPFPTHILPYMKAEEDMARVYALAHLFVLPSLQESLSLTTVEALLSGTPTVAFRTGALPELIDHKKNGFLAPLRSSDGLCEGMKWILEHGDYDALSRHTREKAAEMFSEEKTSLAYLELYRKHLNTSGTHA